MLLAKLRALLDQKSIRYALLEHSPAYTAQEVAAKLHVHGWELAKTTVVRADDRFLMVVLPAPSYVDLRRVCALAGTKSARLATEDEIATLLPGCEIGAMPPFGNLWGVPVWVDERLALDQSIVFSAGTHHEAIRLSFADYRRLVEPQIVSVATARAPQRAA